MLRHKKSRQIVVLVTLCFFSAEFNLLIQQERHLKGKDHAFTAGNLYSSFLLNTAAAAPQTDGERGGQAQAPAQNDLVCVTI